MRTSIICFMSCYSEQRKGEGRSGFYLTERLHTLYGPIA